MINDMRTKDLYKWLEKHKAYFQSHPVFRCDDLISAQGLQASPLPVLMAITCQIMLGMIESKELTEPPSILWMRTHSVTMTQGTHVHCQVPYVWQIPHDP